MKLHHLFILPLITSTPALACNPSWGPCAGAVVLGPVGPQQDYGQATAQANAQRAQQTQNWTQGNQKVINSWSQQAPRGGPQGQPARGR